MIRRVRNQASLSIFGIWSASFQNIKHTVAHPMMMYPHCASPVTTTTHYRTEHRYPGSGPIIRIGVVIPSQQITKCQRKRDHEGLMSEEVSLSAQTPHANTEEGQGRPNNMGKRGIAYDQGHWASNNYGWKGNNDNNVLWGPYNERRHHSGYDYTYEAPTTEECAVVPTDNDDSQAVAELPKYESNMRHIYPHAAHAKRTSQHHGTIQQQQSALYTAYVNLVVFCTPSAGRFRPLKNTLCVPFLRKTSMLGP